MYPKILIDADGCPVVDETIELADIYNIECIILCDTSHNYDYEGIQTLTFPKGKDSVDFALIKYIHAGDIVITQDYGLATLCLTMKAVVFNQNGFQYTNDNIEELLHTRYQSSKARKEGIRLQNAKKRTTQQDEQFYNTLEEYISRL